MNSYSFATSQKSQLRVSIRINVPAMVVIHFLQMLIKNPQYHRINASAGRTDRHPSAPDWFIVPFLLSDSFWMSNLLSIPVINLRLQRGRAAKWGCLCADWWGQSHPAWLRESPMLILLMDWSHGDTAKSTVGTLTISLREQKELRDAGWYREDVVYGF